ncbi:hypothetical protein [Pseudoalteromonas ardens]|uniref:hypothetical protein n=1 Tax=Pseudoalteromonas ardens TaxID=3048490 RepID=UPI0024C3CA19|nr:hypothetical protein [Pseudoalteromonas sp. R96]MDK1313709.1 hypothetical protein [Pseudoalteromonas sp. R96]
MKFEIVEDEYCDSHDHNWLIDTPSGQTVMLSFNLHRAFFITQGDSHIEIPQEWFKIEGSCDEVEISQGAKAYMGIGRAYITSSIPGLDASFVAIGIKPEEYYALMEFEELKPFFNHNPLEA